MDVTLACEDDQSQAHKALVMPPDTAVCSSKCREIVPEEFVDVTLACEDEQSQAHKVLVMAPDTAVCSSKFRAEPVFNKN